MDVEKDDVENCLYFGTPLEDAQSCFLSRKQPLTNRAPRVWEQIVTDERGRRRLHGAFTGGFSAGYFNTVDTKEGFIPKTFKTSRSNRAEDRKQEIHEFYDKDELEELQKVDVVAHDGYDTFSSMRSEKIKERTEAEAAARPIIPGGVITEFIEGVAESIGVKLLQKMGWRQGKGIGEAFKSSTEQEVELDWGPDASLAQEGTQFWKQKPKMNVHGLSFDPFRGSRDFAKAKSEMAQKSHTKRPRGIAFGVGVLEETDTFGEMADYVDNSTAQDRINYYEISDDSDDNQPSSNRDHHTKLLTHESHPSKQGDSSFIPGFHLSTVLKEQRIFQLPVVPPGFTGRIQRLEQGDKGRTEGTGKLPVPAAQVPIDLEKKKLIDSVAVFVAKGGYPSEELARTQHQGDGNYSFLFGGENCEYYRWKLLDVKVTFQKLGVECFGQRQTPLTADDRGFLLGDEKLIEESKLESKNKAMTHLDIQGVPEADRSRVKTALNSNFVKGSQETGLQVEEVIPGLRAPRPKDQIKDKKEDSDSSKNQRTGDGLVPVRWFLDWHPTPLVYKRFKIQDPFKGQIQETEPQSKFMSYEAQLNEVKEEDNETNKLTTSDTNEVDITLPPPEYTEPPLDIFKSIFDASDQEEETEPVQKSDSPIQESSIRETKDTLREESSPKQHPPNRKKLKVSSDESSEGEETRNLKKSAKSDETSSESIDEEIFSGLSTSEFKKLLKTLKKEQKRKSKSKKDRKREKKKKKKNRKSKV